MVKAKQTDKPKNFETGGNISFETTEERITPVYTEEVQAPVVERGPQPERILRGVEAERAAGRKALARHQARAAAYPRARQPGERHPMDGTMTPVLRPNDPRLDRRSTSVIEGKDRPAQSETAKVV